MVIINIQLFVSCFLFIFVFKEWFDMLLIWNTALILLNFYWLKANTVSPISQVNFVSNCFCYLDPSSMALPLSSVKDFPSEALPYHAVQLGTRVARMPSSPDIQYGVQLLHEWSVISFRCVCTYMYTYLHMQTWQEGLPIVCFVCCLLVL